MKVTKTFDFDEIKAFKFGSWPFGYPKLFVYAYVIDGLLIDTGHTNMQKEILQTLSSILINQVFITHHHEDHCGNALAIQKQKNCPVYAPSLCTELMKNQPGISFVQWLSWGKSKSNHNVVPKDDVVRTERYNFEIIPIPGHAVDMVGLFEASKGWFFSGDLFVNEYIKFFKRDESMATQIQSIKKVLQLDFDMLLCNHNPQQKGGKDLFRQKLQFLQDFYGNVRDLYQKGYGPSGIMKELGLRENWGLRILSQGELSTLNMIKSVIRDEQQLSGNTL